MLLGSRSQNAFPPITEVTARKIDAVDGRTSRGGDFAAKTISGVTGALEQAVFDQETATLPGLLQSVDARSKLAGALMLLLAIGLARHIEVVLAVSVIIVLLARFSKLSLRAFLRRAWLGVPLFAAIVVAPSLFLLPGTPLIVLNVFVFHVAISDNALAGAILFVTRVAASVSLALLLISTTRWTELLRALRFLRMPESIVVVLGMTYRYLFLFLHAANNLFLARASRTVGFTTGTEQRRWVAGAAGALMGRSMKISNDVVMAMQARGFAGEVRTATDNEMRDQDWLFLALGVALSAGVVLADRGLR